MKFYESIEFWSGTLAIIVVIFVMIGAVVFISQRLKAKNDVILAKGQIALKKAEVLYPLQLRAYERLIIFLERMTPAALIHRCQPGTQNSAQLQFELMKTVREEFEHNQSMQIYVSQNAWKLLVTAKDDVLHVVKTAATLTEPADTSLRLSQEIFDLEGKIEMKSLKQAIYYLREEAAKA